MKKLFFILSLGFLLLVAPMATAQVQHSDTTYSVSLHAGYAHNLTYGSYGNFDIAAYLPINTYFEAEAQVRLSTANFYTFGVQVRPKFALPIGELYIEDRLLANLLKRDAYLDFTHAISLGYRMQYVDVQVGMFSRVMMPQSYEARTGEEMVCEPFNLLYSVTAFVQPATSPWNISLAIANIDDYQMERMWQPMFYLGGWYDINEHWRVSLNGKLKLAGMFHLNAHYYAAELRVGAEYKF